MSIKLTTVYNEVVRKVGFECISECTSHKWEDLQKLLCSHLTRSGFYTVVANDEEDTFDVKKNRIIVVDNGVSNFWDSTKFLLSEVNISFFVPPTNWDYNIIFIITYNDNKHYVRIHRSVFCTKLSTYEMAEKGWLDLLYHIKIDYYLNIRNCIVPVIRVRKTVYRFITPIIFVRNFNYSHECCFENRKTTSKKVKSLKEIAFSLCFDIECVKMNFNPLCYVFSTFQYTCSLNPQVFLQNMPNKIICFFSYMCSFNRRSTIFTCQ